MSVARLSIGGNQLLLWDAGNRLCEHLAAAIRRIGDGVRVVATPSVRPAGKWFRGRPENELVCLFVEHKQSQAFIDRVAGDEQYYVIVLPPSWEKAGIPRARECLRQTMHLLANETHFTRYFMMDDDVTGVAIPTRSTRTYQFLLFTHVGAPIKFCVCRSHQKGEFGGGFDSGGGRVGFGDGADGDGDGAEWVGDGVGVGHARR